MDKILPLFTTDYSIGTSILTVAKAGEIKDDAPVSVVSIAKHYKINPMVIIEDNLTGFLKTYKYFKDEKLSFIYGLRLRMVSNIEDKSPESLECESDIIILVNNYEGFKDITRIYSKAASDGKYYVPRFDWTLLKKFWTDNLTLAMPFYRSFLASNLIHFKRAVPVFPVEPVFFLESHDLPFDSLIKDAVLKYSKTNGNEIIPSHSIYYMKNSDAEACLVYRMICEHNPKSILERPGLDHFSSDRFSFESYMELTGGKI